MGSREDVQVKEAKRFVLASGSPARLALLRAAGIEPEVLVSGVSEDDVDASSPAEYALELARRKAFAVAAKLAGEPTLVLGCDSVLAFDGEILGKPSTADVAKARWRAMRGRSGTLHTGHCVVETGTGNRAEATGSTTVHFAAVSDGEIDAYVATGEPLDVAGGFKIDGLGGAFVTGMEGDPHNVVGLSLPLLRRLLADLGVFWPDLWTGQPGDAAADKPPR
jgi:septum formation protein